MDQTFDLFDRLGATDEQLDFPIVYASAINGYAGLSTGTGGDMTPLFETIIEKVSPPPVDMDGPFQMQVTSLDYNTPVLLVSVGFSGTIKPNMPLVIVNRRC
jgi:GTP-binding protein